jgi:hypothetical protein
LASILKKEEKRREKEKEWRSRKKINALKKSSLIKAQEFLSKF